MKVTPAHDFKDYELGERHKLQLKDVLSDNGLINVDVENFMVIINQITFGVFYTLLLFSFITNIYFFFHL